MPALEGPLLGDKINNLRFDNYKIRSVTEDWRCRIALSDGLARAAEHVRLRLDAGYSPDPASESAINQLIIDLAPMPV